METPEDTNEPLAERDVVLFRRFNEARDAGLTLAEANRFAESNTDVGQLRKLVAAGCPPATIARIIT